MNKYTVLCGQNCTQWSSQKSLIMQCSLDLHLHSGTAPPLRPDHTPASLQPDNKATRSASLVRLKWHPTTDGVNLIIYSELFYVSTHSRRALEADELFIKLCYSKPEVCGNVLFHCAVVGTHFPKSYIFSGMILPTKIWFFSCWKTYSASIRALSGSY